MIFAAGGRHTGREGEDPVTKEEERARNKEKVIAAALDCIQQMPVNEVTRVAIANRAGLTPRSLQRYFGTLDNLMQTVTQRYLEHFNQCHREAFHAQNIAGKSGLEHLKFFLCSYEALFDEGMPSAVVLTKIETYWRKRENPPFHVLFPPAAEKFYGTGEYKYDLFHTLLHAGRRDGSIRGDLDPDSVYLWLTASFAGLIRRVGTVPEMYGGKEKQIIRSFAQAVADYLAAE